MVELTHTCVVRVRTAGDVADVRVVKRGDIFRTNDAYPFALLNLVGLLHDLREQFIVSCCINHRIRHALLVHCALIFAKDLVEKYL